MVIKVQVCVIQINSLRVFFFFLLSLFFLYVGQHCQLILSCSLLLYLINVKILSIVFFFVQILYYYLQFYYTDITMKFPLIQITFSFSVVPLCVCHYISVSCSTVRVLNVQEREMCCSPVLCWITESRSTHKTQSSIIP